MSVPLIAAQIVLSERQPLARCLALGIEPILWFPVLADAPGAESLAEHLVLTVEGMRARGSSGRWIALDCVAERFELLCPNQEEALHPVEERFARRFGYPLARLRKKALGVLGEIRERPGAGAQWARRWTGEGSLWQYPFLRDLGEFRADSIARLVGRFTARARRHGLSVGLDLFSPAIAALVGQDYRRLAEIIAPASAAPAAPEEAAASGLPEARLAVDPAGLRWPRE